MPQWIMIIPQYRLFYPTKPQLTRAGLTSHSTLSRDNFFLDLGKKLLECKIGIKLDLIKIKSCEMQTC